MTFHTGAHCAQTNHVEPSLPHLEGKMGPPIRKRWLYLCGLGAYVKYHCLWLFSFFFYFFTTRAGRHGWPILTTYTSKYTFLHKEVAFSCKEMPFCSDVCCTYTSTGRITAFMLPYDARQMRSRKTVSATFAGLSSSLGLSGSLWKLLAHRNTNQYLVLY